MSLLNAQCQQNQTHLKPLLTKEKAFLLNLLLKSRGDVSLHPLFSDKTLYLFHSWQPIMPIALRRR